MFCHQCGKEVNQSSQFCTNCGAELSIENNIKKDEDTRTPIVVETVKVLKEQTSENVKENIEKVSTNNKKKELEGISGWLTVLGLGLMISPLSRLYYLTSGWGNYLVLTRALSILLIIYGVYVFYLMIKRKKDFINYCGILFIAQAIIAVVNYLALKNFYNDYAVTSEITASLSKLESNIFSAFFLGLIWILYLRSSKRVKLTFIK